jgi:hypothetical protein
MPLRIVPIVEGHGEVTAVPILLRRLIAMLDLGIPISVEQPIRQPRGSLLKEGGLERAVGLAAIKGGELGEPFILIDSEGECPAVLGPIILSRANRARPDQQVSVVLAHHEFEAWFLASGSSLKGQCRMSDEIEDHASPEDVQDCKGWLEQWMPLTSKYSETADQPSLTAIFNIDLTRRRSSSFDKLYREFETICRQAI